MVVGTGYGRPVAIMRGMCTHAVTHVEDTHHRREPLRRCVPIPTLTHLEWSDWSVHRVHRGQCCCSPVHAPKFLSFNPTPTQPKQHMSVHSCDCSAQLCTTMSVDLSPICCECSYSGCAAGSAVMGHHVHERHTAKRCTAPTAGVTSRLACRPHRDGEGRLRRRQSSGAVCERRQHPGTARCILVVVPP